MPLAETLAVLMVVAVIAALMAGYPVALTLAGVSLACALIGHLAGAMDLAILGALPQRIFGVITNPVLLAIPLFVFMGVMLEQSRIAEQLLERMGRLFGTLRGGLAFSVVIVGALLAASTGIVGATAVTMGLIMLPAMLRHGYDPRLAAGTVAASATLAQIVPPSTVLVVLGDQLNNAYQAAQLAQGNFAPSTVSVSDLFAGAVAPGLLLVGLYLLYLVAMALWRPQSCPAIRRDDMPPGSLIEALLAPVVLIAAVLGSILMGVATPTEAASVGAVGAILLAARKTALRTVLRPVVDKTTQITAMIFLILIGATLFSLVFRALGGDVLVHRALTDLPGGVNGALLAVMLAIFLLGFVMDAFEIIFVVVPIVAPALLKMPGVDPVWLGILMAVNLQTSYMHPPLGPTLFYLRGVAPPEITTRHIYVGIIPFVLIQLVALLVLWFVPGLATALPHALYGQLREAPHESRRHVQPEGPRGAGDRRLQRSRRAIRQGARRQRRRGGAGGAAGRAAETLKEEIEAAGGRAVAIEADVTDRAAMARAFDAAEKAFGTVTILVNNAGIAQSPSRAIEVTPEEWRKVLSIDLDAVFHNAQEAARRMLAAQKQGSIINISSVLGFGVAKGTAAYAVAKAAVVQTTKALALELAFKGVRVNAIAPGWFVTEINDAYLMSEAGTALKREIPMGRFGNPGDLDGALLLLASDAGSYITGATILVDGGQVIQIKG